MKILHVVENLHRGAVENWLVRMLRHARVTDVDVDWTFYCALGKEGQLDGEVRMLGARIEFSPVPIGRKIAFLWALREELRRGKYDVLHCHHDLVSAVYLAAAMGMPIRKRLVHVHNADEGVLTCSRMKQAVLRPLIRRTCLALADGIVGISNHTLDTFLAGRPRREGMDRVHYYGIDPTAFFHAKGDRYSFLQELGLAADARILLFAGRMVPEKNPLFAVDTFAEMHHRDSRVVGVFVGAGSMEAAVKNRVMELQLRDAFRLLGWRRDVAEIMNYCDWFILPRPEKPMEGLGIVVVEAQLAGLRMLLSRGIADDPLLPGAVFRRLPLAAGPANWAKAAMDLRNQTPRRRQETEELLTQSPFDMDFALEDLLRLYG